MRPTVEVLAAYSRGDSITDQELLDLHRHIDCLLTLVNKLGPTFHIVSLGVALTYQSLSSMVDARNLTHAKPTLTKTTREKELEDALGALLDIHGHPEDATVKTIRAIHKGES